MRDEMQELFADFVADQGGAITQLRMLVGGQIGPRLNGSIASLKKLDAFIEALTEDPSWKTSPLFGDAKDIESWLAVRLAYYLGWVLNQTYGAEWVQVSDPQSPIHGAPVMYVDNIQLNPLHIATEYLRGTVSGGLSGFLSDLEAELHPSSSTQ